VAAREYAEPTSDPQWKEVDSVLVTNNWTLTLRGRTWEIIDAATDVIASFETDADPVTAIRRLTAKPEPSVDELTRELLMAVDTEATLRPATFAVAKKLRKALAAKGEAGEDRI
jgi:hypothetical protein